MCSLMILMIDSTKLGALCYKCSHFRRLSKPTRARPMGNGVADSDGEWF